MYKIGRNLSEHKVYSEIVQEYHYLPEDYIYTEDFNLFYKFYENYAYYDDANTTCQTDGAYVATPRSYDENQFLIDLFPNKDLWIGVNDIDSEGDFISVDGHKMTYFRWGSNEPNDMGGNEDGVQIVGTVHYGEISKWNDVSIERLFRFVCFRRL